METKSKRTAFDFIGKRRTAAIMSALVCLASLILLIKPGPDYSIDFEGGTNIILHFNESIDDAELESAMSDIGFTDAVAQRFGPEGDNQYLVQTKAVSSLSAEQAEEIRTSVVAEFGAAAEVEIDESSGDRLYVRIPEDAYLDAGETLNTDDMASRYGERAPAIADSVAELFAGLDVGATDVERFGSPIDRRYIVHIAALQSSVNESLIAAFGASFDRIERIETVGPRVGEQLRNDGINSILIALVGILLYIALRFDFRYAPGAVVALAHDVLITLGLFIILGQEISLPIVAALLTIVGYSLNDTIVNFDRIRENLDLVGGSTKNLEDLVNRSLNECLSRTVLTSVTTLIAVLSIFFLGGGLIRSFALAMIIGVIVGTYSSVFVASPIMIATTRWIEARQE